MQRCVCKTCHLVLEALYNISTEWSEQFGSQTKDYMKMQVITAQGIKKTAPSL